jgi:hypothetical protein
MSEPLPSTRLNALKYVHLLNSENYDLYRGRMFSVEATKKMSLLLLLCFVVFVYLIILTISGINNENGLDARGIMAEGVITEKHISSSGEDGTTYRIEYSYVVPHRSPLPYVSNAEIDFSVYQRLEVGTPVMVTYLPEDPAISRVEGMYAHTWMSPLVVTVVVGIGLVKLMMTIIGEYQRDKGRLLLGKIVSWDTQEKEDENGEYSETVMTYQFKTRRGRQLRDRKVLRNVQRDCPSNRHLAIVYVNDHLHEVL